MKKKILFGILFFTLLTINIITISKTNVSDLSLMNLLQNANAQMEDDNGKGLDCICTECMLWNPTLLKYESGIIIIQFQPPIPQTGFCIGLPCGYGFC